jgi:hypothetical protein
MSSNFGEIIKKTNSCVWGKARQRATQATPPPPARRLNLATFTHGENAKLRSHAPDPPAREREGGEIPRFLNNSTTEQYFKMLLSHEEVYYLSSPYCIGKLCSSPFYVPGK